MVQKLVASLVDDLDGGPANATVEFGLDGKHYEIDLSDSNAAALRSTFAEFVAAARKLTSMRRGEKIAPVARVDREQNQAVRSWARAHGRNVSARGRIPTEVIEAYHQSSQK